MTKWNMECVIFCISISKLHHLKFELKCCCFWKSFWFYAHSIHCLQCLFIAVNCHCWLVVFKLSMHWNHLEVLWETDCCIPRVSDSMSGLGPRICILYRLVFAAVWRLHFEKHCLKSTEQRNASFYVLFITVSFHNACTCWHPQIYTQCVKEEMNGAIIANS